MNRTQVQSSNIRSVGHEGTELEVEFQNGTIWRYHGVPPHVFRTLTLAPSVGKAFAAEVKDRYGATKVR